MLDIYIFFNVYLKECIKIFDTKENGGTDNHDIIQILNEQATLVTGANKDIHFRTLKSILSTQAIPDIYNFHKYIIGG